MLFTDGVSESMNAHDEEWGEDRLIEFAKTCHGLPAFEAMTRILAAAEAFAAGASQHDDMTLVVLRVAYSVRTYAQVSCGIGSRLGKPTSGLPVIRHLDLF